MIDYFALGLAHFLIVVALIRMLSRDYLDRDPQPEDEAVTAPEKAG